MIKLLIVDDEKLLRKGFIHMTDWTSHGYCIVGEAGNGEEALQAIEAVGPDIVVTDIKMPGMDGIELIRAIKSDYPHIKVIVLSSYSDFPYVKESLQLGAADYILKASMSFDEVLRALEKLTDKSEEQPVSQACEDPQFKSANERGDSFYDIGKGRSAEAIKEDEAISIGSWRWKEIRPFVEAGELDALYDVIRATVLGQVEQGQAPEPYELRKSLVELGYMIIHKLDEAGWNPNELQQQKLSLFRSIESAASFEDCMDAFKEVLAAIHRFQSSNGYWKTNLSPTVKAVINYIHQHYAEPGLSLSEAARRFHLNKSYLSQLFKQQVGENFQNYVTRIRMDKAKELLRQNEPVNEVGFAVGIDNISYFSQLFKRWVGVSPSDYARNI